MAVNPLSPGVYIDEISVFPPSVAPVATAVPAFIGYTEKGPSMVPTRITSMLEFESVFGGAFDEQFKVTITNGPSIAIDDTLLTDISEYTLHYHMRMYFANGGGPCYIVSVDTYDNSAFTIDWALLRDGIAVTEKADEVTLLVIPESVSSQVDDSQRGTLYNDMMALCAKLKDRFAIMDVLMQGSTIFNDASNFRNNTGLGNLKYGAAYYPALKTLLSQNYEDSAIEITDSRTPVVTGTNFGNTHFLSDIQSGIAASGTLTVPNTVTAGNSINVAGVVFTCVSSYTITPENEFLDDPDALVVAATLAGKINAHTVAGLVVTATLDNSSTSTTATLTIKAKVAGSAGNGIFLRSGTGGLLPSSSTGKLSGGIDADNTLYNQISAALGAYTMELYPSATMAGIYASVDRDRGVWKAPANVSLAGVVAPSVNISASDQDGLNVDATSGKSINAIRAFAGKGILAWGARTLAGNDSEWRYINVRRLFIFAEESIQKASEFVVFEPNDRNTWTRVNTLITNFLTNLWRDGALAGATAKDAFFVKVGLGETMTAQDILEGKMIIQVGLAAVRPAEFIILQFSHKLQES